MRDVARIETPAKKPARALTDNERNAWFDQLRSDPQAVRKDLPDLSNFMLGTGARIGETLAIVWEQVNFDTREVDLTHTIVRVKGKGLIRKKTKSDAGQRVLRLPSWTITMLQARYAAGLRLDQPVFADALGGFRDPSNVRRDLRNARSPIAAKARQTLGKHVGTLRRASGRTQTKVAEELGWPKSRISLIETARVKLDHHDAQQLLDLYEVAGHDKTLAMELVGNALNDQSDALAWLTSHVFRKTTATVLDDAGQSARQVADQLGHSRTSMTQDAYIARKVRNPAAADALEDTGPSL